MLTHATTIPPPADPAEYCLDAEEVEITFPIIAIVVLLILRKSVVVIFQHLWGQRKATLHIVRNVLFLSLFVTAVWLGLWFQAVQMGAR